MTDDCARKESKVLAYDAERVPADTVVTHLGAKVKGDKEAVVEADVPALEVARVPVAPTRFVAAASFGALVAVSMTLRTWS